MSDAIRSVHAWGHFRDDDIERPELPSGMAPSTLTPWQHFERLRRHQAHWGDESINVKVTRTLDGRFVAAEWTSPPRKGSEVTTLPMWHAVMKPDRVWADFPEQPTQ